MATPAGIFPIATIPGAGSARGLYVAQVRPPYDFHWNRLEPSKAQARIQR